MIGLECILKLEKQSAKDISERLKVCPATVSQWLKQQRPIPTDKIALLHTFYPYYSVADFERIVDKAGIEYIKQKKVMALANQSNDLREKAIYAGKKKQLQFSANKQEVLGKISDILDVAYDLRGEEDTPTHDAFLSQLNDWCEFAAERITKIADIN